ncbi:anthranilate phosphoribosyltransferase [Brevibacillus humidisoli]|uniref:anthranilate phosphoribosyltransferase n=1 Tax=Brevibacillus humidisoli TaxID=2895522 RepID=UPI001E5F693B|nr:anthranilate phosphoribosyltransferase [Brevibacillus humidisoli]UFJ39622.1 anthranilate phosphoribosyltransferase [Brevibacillus humidisoli]
MFELLKEVGRGKRGAKDLTYDQAAMAAEMFLNGTATTAQISAFLMAERIKTESVEEILAFIDVYRRDAFLYPMPTSLDCAGPYDGRRASFLVTLPAAFVLSACGLPVTLHSSPSLPPKWGVTLLDVMRLLHIPFENKKALCLAAAESGVLFIPTEDWCPALHRLRPLRMEIGVRTLFNTVEKLLRLSDPSSVTVGVFHGTALEKAAQLLIRLGIKRGIVVQGMEGSEDVTVSRRTRTLLIQEGHSEPYMVEPALLGLQTELPDVIWTAERQLQTTIAVLNGEAEQAYHNLVLLNSALRLWGAGHADTLAEGVEMASHALDAGLALEQYHRWLNTVCTGSSRPTHLS